MTDANLVLGYLDENFFLGGRMQLDTEAAQRAILRHIGEPLGLELLRAAWGIHEVINEDVARAFRVYASERGFDYRRSSMIAFGGSGPMHAVRIARKLGIPKVVLPAGAGVMSALGLLVSPLAFETVRSRRVELSLLDDLTIDHEFRPLVEHARRPLLEAGVSEDQIQIVRKIDMRYIGQGHEIEVDLRDERKAAKIDGLFIDAYRRLFSSVTLSDPIETVNWKVEAHYDRKQERSELLLSSPRSAGDKKKEPRAVFFVEAGEKVRCEVFDRTDLQFGRTYQGPALIEERESTCVIGPEDAFSIDAYGNVIVNLNGGAAS